MAKKKRTAVSATKTTPRPERIRDRVLRPVKRTRVKKQPALDKDGWPMPGNTAASAGAFAYLATFDYLNELKAMRDEWDR